MFKLIWLIREVNRLRRRCESLEQKLDYERERNRTHEDQILSRFVSLHGLVGVEAREAEVQKKPEPHKPLDFESIKNNLSPYHQSMLALYEEEGLARGIDLGQIHSDFYELEILGREQIQEVPQ